MIAKKLTCSILILGLFVSLVGCGATSKSKKGQGEEPQIKLPSQANIIDVTHGDGTVLTINVDGKPVNISMGSDVKLNPDVTSLVGSKAKIENNKVTTIIPIAKTPPVTQDQYRDSEVVDYAVRDGKATLMVYNSEGDTVKSYALDSASQNKYTAKDLIGHVIKINLTEKNKLESIEIVSD